jgi:hypothetical protein
MAFDQVCRKCTSSELQRSRIHNLFEFLISPLFVMYRCVSCQTRQAKFRTLPMGAQIDKSSYGR